MNENRDASPSATTLARATRLNLLARVTNGASTLGLAVLTTNVLTTHGRGVYAILSTIAGIAATVVQGGTPVLAADLIHGRRDESVLHGASLAIAACSALVLAPLAAGFSLLTNNGTLTALLCTAALTSLLIYSYFEMYVAQARGDVVRVSFVLVGMALFPLISSAVMATAFNATATTLIAAWAVGMLVLALMQFASAVATAGIVIRHAMRVGAGIMRRSLGVLLSNVVNTLTARIDVLVVAVVISVSAAGIYSIPVALSTGLLLLSRSLLTATYHSIMTAPASSVGVRLGSALRHSVLVVLVGGCLSVPVVAVASGSVFGEAYSGIWGPYAILVFASVGTCIAEMLRHVLITRLERQREYVLISTGVLIVNGVLAFAGAALYGLPGAAASTTISYGCEALAMLAVCSRLLSVPVRSLVVPTRSDLASYWRVLRVVPARLRGTGVAARWRARRAG